MIIIVNMNEIKSSIILSIFSVFVDTFLFRYITITITLKKNRMTRYIAKSEMSPNFIYKYHEKKIQNPIRFLHPLLSKTSL